MRPHPAGNHPDDPLLRASRVARSGFRRYPTQLAESVSRRNADHASFPLVLPSEPQAELHAAWLGHASVLLRINGAWVLTDPVFSRRIGVNLGPLTLGVARRAPLPVIESLPPIDLILVSHAHFDHLDRPTLARLANPRTTVVTAANTRSLIPAGFGAVHELPWRGRLNLPMMSLSALEPAHWGARTVWDRHRGYNAYVLEAPRSRVLFAGDTAITPAFRTVNGTDLSIFGIGAYDPWITKHASPEQVWTMHGEAGGRFLLPMHHSTFELSDEPFEEPMQRLLAAAGDQSHRIVGRELGSFWSMP